MITKILICLVVVLGLVLVFVIRSNSQRHKEISEKDSQISTLIKDNNEERRRALAEKDGLAQKIKELETENNKLKELIENYRLFYKNTQSNLTLFPYMAGIVSEFETRDIEMLARKLEWGSNAQREKKVASIRLIRKEAQDKINQAKVAEYQLAYLLRLFPSLGELIEYDYSELPKLTDEALSEEHDNTRDYLSKEEWDKLTVAERNQLALDRYIESRKKTNWQIGRDYEEYIGYTYRKSGYTVDNYGERMGLEDLGRDIIARKGNKTFIIQCKYWSQKKQIHENHINQLFGTVTSYCIENGMEGKTVTGILVTNANLSETAKKFAERLGIEYHENVEIGNFPRIKCNLGHDEWGETRIYHLPFDQQYDATVISKPGEFYAMTVEEAERAGFRRAFKWFGT